MPSSSIEDDLVHAAELQVRRAQARDDPAVRLNAATGGDAGFLPHRLQGVRDPEFKGWRRIAPVLLPHLRAPSPRLWGDTLIAAHLTHDDLLSNASCVAFVQMLWQLLGMQALPDKRWWIDTWLATSEPPRAGRPDGSLRSRARHPPTFNGPMAEMVAQHVRPALDRDMDVAAARSSGCSHSPVTGSAMMRRPGCASVRRRRCDGSHDGLVRMHHRFS